MKNQIISALAVRVSGEKKDSHAITLHESLIGMFNVSPDGLVVEVGSTIKDRDNNSYTIEKITISILFELHANDTGIVSGMPPSERNPYNTCINILVQPI